MGLLHQASSHAALVSSCKDHTGHAGYHRQIPKQSVNPREMQLASDLLSGPSLIAVEIRHPLAGPAEEVAAWWPLQQSAVYLYVHI